MIPFNAEIFFKYLILEEEHPTLLRAAHFYVRKVVA